MSYLVLARKWRPKKFSEMVGQPHVARTLLNGLKQSRLAHAYLFCGPRGVGKTTAARLLARAINCRNSLDGEPCGTCQSCTSIAEGNFIDVIEIDAASNTGVDDVRKLREGIRYTPIEGQAKVYIIDEVHMLSTGAFNALLKTLEEPPSHAYFCLATTDPQKVPPTILSRCQRFDFRRVSVAEIRSHLEKICTSEKLDFEAEVLDIVARRADGSVRDSLSILDQVIAFAGDRLTKQDAVDVVGEVRLDLYFRAVELTRSGSHEEAFLLDEELSYTGTDIQDFLLGLEEHLIHILQVKTSGIDKVDVPPEYRDSYVKATADLAHSDLVRLLQLCAAAETDVRRNYNPRIRLQLLLLKFASFDKSVIIEDLLKKFGGQGGSGSAESAGSSRPQVPPAGSGSGGRSSPPRQSPPSTPPQTPGTTRGDNGSSQRLPENIENRGSILIGDLPAINPDDALNAAQNAWNSVCDRIAQQYNSRGHMIRYSGYPVSYVNGQLIINLRDNGSLDMAQSTINVMRQAFSEVLGKVDIRLQLGEVPSNGTTAPATNGTEDDPKLQMLVDRLGAKLVK